MTAVKLSHKSLMAWQCSNEKKGFFIFFKGNDKNSFIFFYKKINFKNNNTKIMINLLYYSVLFYYIFKLKIK